MKQPSKATRKQKEAISAAKLNSNNWGVALEEPGYLYLVHKLTGSKKTISNTGGIQHVAAHNKRETGRQAAQN